MRDIYYAQHSRNGLIIRKATIARETEKTVWFLLSGKEHAQRKGAGRYTVGGPISASPSEAIIAMSELSKRKAIDRRKRAADLIREAEEFEREAAKMRMLDPESIAVVEVSQNEFYTVPI